MDIKPTSTLSSLLRASPLMAFLAIVHVTHQNCTQEQAAASDPPEIGMSSQALVLCSTPEQFGAAADDGLDDREALLDAIDDACSPTGWQCVDLGAGTYHTVRDPVPGATHVASLKLPCDLTIRGAGAGDTTLAMLGSGIRAGQTAPGDWHLLSTSFSLTLSDLTLDGAERIQTSEQTHLLQLTAGANDVVVERVAFNLPSIGPSSGGDCFRMIGAATAWVSGVTMRDSVGLDCDRSFVGLQRFVEDVTLLRVESVNTEVALDLEPTGTATPDCSPIIRNLAVRDSALRRGTGVQGGYTIHMGGLGCSLASGILVADTVVDDGGMTMLDVGDVTLSNLHLRNLPSESAEPTLQARKRVVRLRLVNTVVERVAGSATGQVIKVAGQSGFNPTDLTLLGSELVQHVEGVPLYGESLESIIMAGSKITYLGPSTGLYGIKNRGITGPAGSPVVVDSVMTGALAGVAEMTGTTDGGTPVVVRTALTP